MSIIQSSEFELLARLRSIFPKESQIYLVGGAVRDILLSKPFHDLDFVLPNHAIEAARKTANTLKAAYFTLDSERDIGRVIYSRSDGKRIALDFSAIRGASLEEDLQSRDFTINAMAMPLHPPTRLIDPLGGVLDLRGHHIRACRASSFQEDPNRILRALRHAAALEFHILPETRRWMRQALPLLPGVSPERIRDELFRALEGPRPAAFLRSAEIMGVLSVLFPELASLKNISQPPPHQQDAWNHTLDVLQKLEAVLNVLTGEFIEEKAANWAMGFLSLRLGRFRSQIQDHIDASLSPERSRKGLLFWSALYHDVAKPETIQIDAHQRIRFFEHENIGAERIAERGHSLHLSNHEIDLSSTIVRNHMRPLHLAQGSIAPSRRAIYRYFRDCGSAGIDIGLLSLADVLATYGPTLPQEKWERHLDIVRALFEAWWEKAETTISPPPMINGNQLMQKFSLKPGPLIGQLLEALREAQVEGLVADQEEAFQYAANWLEQASDRPAPL